MSAVEHLADEVFVPPLDHPGWGEKTDTEAGRLYHEATALESAMARMPSKFTPRARREFDPVLKAKFDDFQATKGYSPGSVDMTLMDEFVLGRRLHFKPQRTGSCTISNTFRMWTRKVLAEVILRGQLEEPLGTTEYGPTSFAFYAPLSYGIARQMGNLRRGDGGFCEETIESLMLGVLPCNNGNLLELLTQLGANADTDFPEPQNNDVYRKFQNWTYNERFKPFLKNPLIESIPINNTDLLVETLEQFKPVPIASMLAVKKLGTHQGLSFFGIDRNNSWAHLMCWAGTINWHGRKFVLLSNESWQANLIYPIPIDEVSKIFSSYRPSCLSLGEIDLDDSVVHA